MSVSKPWRLGLATSAAAAVAGTVYFYVRQYLKDGVWHFDLTLVNKALGTAALLLLTLSMGLTAWAYFRPGRGRWLAYRKHLGLVGFWTGLVHGAATHFMMPAFGLQPERKMDALLTDGPGLAALVLFGVMAVLSNAPVKGKIGGERWRKLLRYGGYAGLVLAAGHAALLKWSSWIKYLRTFDPVLPSLSLPVAALAAAAIVGRLAMWLSARRRA
jgi:DMSO/TMAO reductase YedYZ heme-binding membrane subunit